MKGGSCRGRVHYNAKLIPGNGLCEKPSLFSIIVCAQGDLFKNPYRVTRPRGSDFEYKTFASGVCQFYSAQGLICGLSLVPPCFLPNLSVQTSSNNITKKTTTFPPQMVDELRRKKSYCRETKKQRKTKIQLSYFKIQTPTHFRLDHKIIPFSNNIKYHGITFYKHLAGSTLEFWYINWRVWASITRTMEQVWPWEKKFSFQILAATEDEFLWFHLYKIELLGQSSALHFVWCFL